MREEVGPLGCALSSEGELIRFHHTEKDVPVLRGLRGNEISAGDILPAFSLDWSVKGVIERPVREKGEDKHHRAFLCPGRRRGYLRGTATWRDGKNLEIQRDNGMLHRLIFSPK